MSTVEPATTLTTYQMTPQERRSSASLATLYGLRILGLFMVLPVFVIEAKAYEGGQDQTLVGWAMGLYGLVQAALQIPYGLAADRFGRKRVIVLGLLIFAIGSFWGATTHSIYGLAWARALQGAGAISAAVSALLADQTRNVVRTKGMAIIGISIGLMFALSLVIGPLLGRWGGLPLIFAVTGCLAMGGVAVVLFWTPVEQTHMEEQPVEAGLSQPAEINLSKLLMSPELLRLNIGVFLLYASQLATWVALPSLLEQAGLPVSDHGWLYLPVVLLSFLFMGLSLFRLERMGYLKQLFLGSIAVVLLVQLGLMWQAAGQPNLFSLGVLLFLFFCGFNILEATQPSQATRLTPVQARATVLGVYNTLQSLGIFAGAVCGGWLMKQLGAQGVFSACALAMLIWLLAAWKMSPVTAPRDRY